jgi:hypothetical protein
MLKAQLTNITKYIFKKWPNFFSVLETELRALNLPGKRSSTELNPQTLKNGLLTKLCPS